MCVYIIKKLLQDVTPRLFFRFVSWSLLPWPQWHPRRSLIVCPELKVIKFNCRAVRIQKFNESFVFCQFTAHPSTWATAYATAWLGRGSLADVNLVASNCPIRCCYMVRHPRYLLGLLVILRWMWWTFIQRQMLWHRYLLFWFWFGDMKENKIRQYPVLSAYILCHGPMDEAVYHPGEDIPSNI